MAELKTFDHLFCGDEMLRNYNQERQTGYEKSSPLEVLRIANGIVHPLQLPKTSATDATPFGGVTDEKFNFIELSLTKRVSPSNFVCKFNDWYRGTDPDQIQSDIDFVDEDVVFIGALSKHYGHFILEGLARLWFHLDLGNMEYKCVYISEDGEDRFNECFSLFGIKENNLSKVTKPTKFRTVIVPEQSIRLHDFYHIKYKETIEKIKENIKPAKFQKVYFSKAGIGNNRAVGEASIQDVFLNNDFSVFAPEKLSFYEMISILKGCTTFAATSATNIHNSLFMNDNQTCICLNRSAHFHPIQTMIERMRQLESIYVDVFIFPSIKNFGDAPCLLAPTKHLFDFYESQNFRYHKLKHYISMPRYIFKFMDANLKLTQALIAVYHRLKTSDSKIIRSGAENIRQFYRKLVR